MTPINEVRAKNNRVKTHILDRYLKLAEKNNKDTEEIKRYEELTDIFAKSVLPRSQEITGEDGATFTVHIAKEVAVKNDINGTDTSASDNSQGQS